MPLDVEYLAAKEAIEKLQKKLSKTPHGKRGKIADAIILSVDRICDEFGGDGNKVMNKESASDYLKAKLHGAPQAIQNSIFEAIHRINHTDKDVQEILDWFHRVEKAYRD